MVNSLSKLASAIAIAASLSVLSAMSGCAADAVDSSDADDEHVQSAQQALLGGKKAGILPISVQALIDPATGETVIDITTSPQFNLPTEVLHNGDRFRAVAITAEQPDGRSRILGVFGGASIGPGGGCIHFHDLSFNVGDTLRVGAVVTLDAEHRVRVAASAPVEAVLISPPTNVPAPHAPGS